MATRITTTIAGARPCTFILSNSRYEHSLITQKKKYVLTSENYLLYLSTALPPSDQVRAISMLCLLLPHENRNTMRELLNFFKLVVDLQSFNKMSIHNVATITAPSFFPPRFIHPTDKNDIPAQVRMAAQCCHLTNVLIAQNENLWKVPQRLIDEAKKISKNGNVSIKNVHFLSLLSLLARLPCWSFFIHNFFLMSIQHVKLYKHNLISFIFIIYLFV